MKMNRLAVTVLSAAIAVACLSSCTKEGSRLFKGYYSFKTSGTMEVERTRLYQVPDPETQTMTDSTVVDTLQTVLAAESGQMNILSANDKEGEMIVTMNILGGDVVIYEAEASRDELLLRTGSRTLNFYCDGKTVTMNVTVDGSARKIDNVVIFDLEYAGETETAGSELGILKSTAYKILESGVNCVAKENN